jgi:predicted kinase
MANPAGRLIIVCGLPGAGKTTIATDLTKRLGATRFDPDEWMDTLGIDIWDEDRRARLEALQWDLARDLLALGGTAIIVWGTWARSERDTLREGARALGAAVELLYLDAPPDVLFDRVQRRDRETPSITREDFDRYLAAFQAPTAEELALYDPPAKAFSS